VHFDQHLKEAKGKIDVEMARAVLAERNKVLLLKAGCWP
jgi:hypothetical protein